MYLTIIICTYLAKYVAALKEFCIGRLKGKSVVFNSPYSMKSALLIDQQCFTNFKA